MSMKINVYTFLFILTQRIRIWEYPVTIMKFSCLHLFASVFLFFVSLCFQGDCLEYQILALLHYHLNCNHKVN